MVSGWEQDPPENTILKGAEAALPFFEDFGRVPNPEEINRFRLCRVIGAPLPFKIVTGPTEMKKVATDTPVAELMTRLCPEVSVRTNATKDSVSADGEFMITSLIGNNDEIQTWDLTAASNKALLRFANLVNREEVKLPDSLQECIIRGEFNDLHIKNGRIYEIQQAGYRWEEGRGLIETTDSSGNFVFNLVRINKS